MKNKSKTAKSLVWSGIENAGLAIISLAGLVLYSRMLSPFDFGLFSVALAIFELCSLLVTMTFHDALIQRESVSEAHFDTAFTISIFMSLLLLFASWAGAPSFEHLMRVEGSGNVFFAISFAYPALAASSTIVARQRRELNFRALTIRSLGGRIAGLVSGLVAAAYGLGVWSLVTQQICTSCVGSIVLWFTAEYRPRLRFQLQPASEIARFGLVSTLSLVLSFSAKRILVFTAGISIGLTQAGYLNIAFRVVDMLWSILATAVTQVSLPMLTGVRSEKERLRRAYQRAVSFSCLLLFPSFSGIALLAPELLRVVFGERWQPAYTGVTLLAILAVTQTPRLFVNPLLTALGRPQDVLLTTTAELVVLIVALCLWDIHNYQTALIIWAIAETTQIPLSIVRLKRAVGYDLIEQFRGVLRPLLATIVMAGAVETSRILYQDSFNDLHRILFLTTVGIATFVSAAFIFDRSATFSLIAFMATAFGLSLDSKTRSER